MKQPIIDINFETTIPNMRDFFSIYYPNKKQVVDLILEYPYECKELCHALAEAYQRHAYGIYYRTLATEVIEFFDGYLYIAKSLGTVETGYYLQLII